MSGQPARRVRGPGGIHRQVSRCANRPFWLDHAARQARLKAVRTGESGLYGTLRCAGLFVRSENRLRSIMSKNNQI